MRRNGKQGDSQFSGNYKCRDDVQKAFFTFGRSCISGKRGYQGRNAYRLLSVQKPGNGEPAGGYIPAEDKAGRTGGKRDCSGDGRCGVYLFTDTGGDIPIQKHNIQAHRRTD